MGDSDAAFGRQFLADECTFTNTVRRMRNCGCDVVRIQELGMAGTSDAAVYQQAQENERDDGLGIWGRSNVSAVRASRDYRSQDESRSRPRAGCTPHARRTAGSRRGIREDPLYRRSPQVSQAGSIVTSPNDEPFTMQKRSVEPVPGTGHRPRADPGTRSRRLALVRR